MKQGDRVRIKGNLQAEFDKFGITNDYQKELITKAAGRLRTIQYADEREVNGVKSTWLWFRGLPCLPVEFVEAYKKSKPAVSLEKLSDNAILGQDKAKKQLKHAVKADMPVLLIGETGTGKTTLIKDIAENHQQQWLRFNLTGETTVDEFVGKYTLENGKTVWQDGVLLYAMRQGLWLIVDEINVALPEILFVLHSLLDDDKSVMVAQHNGEVVKPHKDFRFFATMNPVEEYAGTKDLNKAFMSRFAMILKLDYPKPEFEKAILIHKAGVEADVADKLVDMAITLRKAKKDGEIFYTCSTRDLIQLGKLSKPLGLADAIQVSIINKANGDGDKIKQYVKRVVDLYNETEKDFGGLNIEKIRETIRAAASELEEKRQLLGYAENDLREVREEVDRERQRLQSLEPQIKEQAKKELIAELTKGASNVTL